MQHFTTDALILATRDRGDHDKLLTVLAPDFGRFYAILKGAHSLRREERVATEPLTYSNMSFYEKNGVKWVKEATLTEAFPGIRMDNEKLFLGAYFAEVAAALSDEREPGGEILPLTLNALYMLSETDRKNEEIKATFEMRAAVIAGFLPDLSGCAKCGAAPTAGGYLDVMNGALICPACFARANAMPLPEVDELGQRRIFCPLSPDALSALSFVAGAPPKRVFAFRLQSAAAMEEFCRAAEVYLLHHLERGFDTLDQYKKLLRVNLEFERKQRLYENRTKNFGNTGI